MLLTYVIATELYRYIPSFRYADINFYIFLIFITHFASCLSL